MVYLVSKITSFFPRKNTAESNPAFTFFFETKSRDKKRVYIKALKKAQAAQERTVRLSKEKASA